jgi:transposase
MPLRDLLYFLFLFLKPWADEHTFEYQAAVPLLPEEPTLTAREVDVAWCIRAGLSNEEIASELNISVSTVKTHVHNLLLKFKEVSGFIVLGAQYQGERARLITNQNRWATSRLQSSFHQNNYCPKFKSWRDHNLVLRLPMDKIFYSVHL